MKVDVTVATSPAASAPCLGHLVNGHDDEQGGLGGNHAPEEHAADARDAIASEWSEAASELAWRPRVFSRGQGIESVQLTTTVIACGASGSTGVLIRIR
jgi:hypothetical protein